MYKRPSIDEVIMMYKKGDEGALNLLFEKMKIHFIVLEKRYRYTLSNMLISTEETLELLKEITFESIKNYDPSKSVFFAYWKTFASFALLKIIKGERNNIDINRSTISFDIFESSNILEDSTINTRDTFDRSNFYEDALEYINDEMGENSSVVLGLWCEGFTYEDIAKMMNLNRNKVNYILRIALNKLRNKFMR